MKYLKVLIKILLISSLFSSDIITISGSVRDADGNLIEGVNIYTSRDGVSTGRMGSFTILCFPDEVVTISHISYSDITLRASEISNSIVMKSRNINAEEIIIKGGSFEKSLKETNTSLMVIQSEDIDKGGYRHFEDTMSLVPNLNSSGGTSRARYFQIRGIGELSQFSGEGAPHFYVGYLMDDIDFSGIGMAGLLNDIKQIEVFKGPQSSVYGPNAMAGMINISSNDPTPHKEGRVSILSGDDRHIGFSAYYSSALRGNLFHRISLFVNKSDGFRENSYLNLTDSNEKDEMMLRYKLLYSMGEDITFKLTYYLININNGYDVWTPDNNGFTTYSDFLGMDTQKSNAISLRSSYRISRDLNLSSITSFSINNIKYGYDSDWGNYDFWKDNYDWHIDSDSYDFTDADVFEWGYYDYSFTDVSTRERKNISQDIRVSGKNIIGGLYVSKTTETDNRIGWLFGGNADVLDSDFNMLNASIYASAEWNLMKNLSLLTRGRVEYNDIKSDVEALYYGSDAGNFIAEANSILWGGRIELNQTLNEKTSCGASLSKGYKSHGVNQSINIGVYDNLANELREYDREDAYNAELSFMFEGKNKSLALNTFYMIRVNPQVRLSYQLDLNNPSSFDFYTMNAQKGYSYGFEGQFRTMITDNLYFYDSFAVLKSHISSYEFLESSIGNRTEAHAPEFSASGGFHYTLESGIYMKLDHSVMFDFYHEDQYESKTDPYQILNTALGWEKNRIELSVWIRNLLDERYVTRGMNFALEPSPDSPPYFYSNSYLSYGDPRHIGASFSYSF